MAKRHALRTAIAIAVCFLPVYVAEAQPVDAATKATARQLGEEGMRALDAGDCATASEKLWRAHDLVHVPTLAFYAGKCLEKLGRLVDAEEKYLEAMRDVVEPNAPDAVKAAQVDAERARDALLPRIPSVLISIRPQALDALVTIDGKPMPPAMIGVKRPIDPGTHDAAVQRAGAVVHRPFVVAEGQAVSVDIELPVVPYGYPYPYPPPRAGYAPYGPPLPAPRALPTLPTLPTQRRNVGLFVAGVVLAPVGAVTSIAGLFVTTSNEGKGLGIAAGGLVVMTAGIVMAVVGGKRVPVAREAPAPSATSVSVEPFFGRGSLSEVSNVGGVRVRF